MFKALKNVQTHYMDQSHLPAVKEPGRRKVEVKITKRVGQGCDLSRLLFNMYTEKTLKVFHAGSVHGMKINGELYKTKFY